MARSPMASDYAIVESGGKQYRAEKGASLLVEHLPADEGAKVSLRAVMYRGDKQVVLDGTELEKVKVEAVVAEHLRGPKVRIFKYKPKKGYRRHAGHRQQLTRLEVTDVRLLTRKPAAKAEPKPAAKGEAGAEEKPAAKAEAKVEAAKPAAKKPAPKKPAAKAKSAARKPAAKKPPTKGKSPTTRRSSSATRRSSSAKKES
jgi:large subunit ribosomal protein L21